MSTRRIVLALFPAALLVAAPILACGPADVCSDVNTSVIGQVLSEGIRVSWATDQEDSGVWGYKVRRYETDPGESTLVAVRQKLSSCTVEQGYSVDDNPPAGDWTYTVEVWTSLGTRYCAFDVVPE